MAVWQFLKLRSEKNPKLVTLGIWLIFFCIKYFFWKNSPNEIPMLIAAVSLISLLNGIKYGLFYSGISSLVELYFFTPNYNSFSMPNAAVLMNFSGYMVLMLFISLIFSSQHEIERQFKNKIAYQKKWIGIASHELKTPLNGLQGLVRIFKSKYPNSPVEISLIDEASKHLDGIVNSLISAANLESKIQILNSEESFSIKKVAEDVVGLMESQIIQKGLLFRFNFSGYDRNIVGNKTEVRQILFNLLSNAIKFTEKGKVELDVSSLADFGKMRSNIHIKVKDTGVGLPKDEISRIFQPFYKSTNNISNQGSGLGLYIIQVIISKLGGSLNCDSEINSGSEFSAIFNLPIETGNSQANLKGNIAFVVDDNPLNRMIMVHDLESIGFSVVSFSLASDALSRLDETFPCVVFSDIHMPEIDGYKFVEEVNKFCQRTGAVKPKIFAVTADVSSEVISNPLNSYFEEILFKPLDQTKLKTALGGYLLVDNDHSNQNEITELMINEAFEKNLEKSIAELRQAIDDQDISNLQKTAHNFRSSCLAANLTKSADDCSEIEKCCRNGNNELAVYKTKCLIDSFNV